MSASSQPRPITEGLDQHGRMVDEYGRPYRLTGRSFCGLPERQYLDTFSYVWGQRAKWFGIISTIIGAAAEGAHLLGLF